MTAPATRPPFWTTPPRPATSADPTALAKLLQILDGAPKPSPVPSIPSYTLAKEAGAGPVRSGGRIIGVILPYPADGDGPVYMPARGPACLRELIDDGIIV